MMIVELDGLIFETAEGTWKGEYIQKPGGYNDSDRVSYYIRFKWLDPNNPENRATPERRLRLLTYHSQTTFSEYEEKLKKAVNIWLDSAEEAEATYVYPSVVIQSSIK